MMRLLHAFYFECNCSLLDSTAACFLDQEKTQDTTGIRRLLAIDLSASWNYFEMFPQSEMVSKGYQRSSTRKNMTAICRVTSFVHRSDVKSRKKYWQLFPQKSIARPLFGEKDSSTYFEQKWAFWNHEVKKYGETNPGSFSSNQNPGRFQQWGHLQLGGGFVHIFNFQRRSLGFQNFMIQFDGCIVFKWGWFNHQLVKFIICQQSTLGSPK